jgi:hypothetical protein
MGDCLASDHVTCKQMQRLFDYQDNLFLVVYPKTLINRHMLPSSSPAASNPIVDRLACPELLSTNNLRVVNLPP